LINEKAGTRNLNDSEFEDDDAGQGGLSCAEESKPRDSKIHTAIASSDRSEVPQACRPHVSQTTELVGKIAQALDPEAQRVCNEERANRSFQNTQVFTLSANLCDAQARIETPRSELNDTHDQLHKVEQEALHSPHSRKNHKYLPDVVRICGKVRHDEYFPEGGQHTTWITDGSSASDWDDDCKENLNPSTEHYHPSYSSTTPSVKPHHRKYVAAKHKHLPQPFASTSSFVSPVRTSLTTGQEEKPQGMTFGVGRLPLEEL